MWVITAPYPKWYYTPSPLSFGLEACYLRHIDQWIRVPILPNIAPPPGIVAVNVKLIEYLLTASKGISSDYDIVWYVFENLSWKPQRVALMLSPCCIELYAVYPTVTGIIDGGKYWLSFCQNVVFIRNPSRSGSHSLSGRQLDCCKSFRSTIGTLWAVRVTT